MNDEPNYGWPGTRTKYQYVGRTTTITDADENARTLVHDVNGWLRETKDASGYAITLGYDAAGSHTLTTDNQGNGASNPLWSSIVQYGIAAFTTQATDADLGTWLYTYDPLGELTNWKDAKAQSFSAQYDLLSRMTDRYEPDLYSHWTWGSSAAAHNIGQLQSVCTGTGANPTACTTSGYAESETYDSAGRLSQRAIAIPGDATYTYTQTYNADGLPDTLTYPVSTAGYALVLKFGYAYGLLNSITDTSDSPSVALWAANTMDTHGQYSQETLGNGVVVNHAFDPYRGLPQSITAGLNGGTALQNNSYLFDPVGNLTQRQDNNAGTTESVYYDSLNRLSYTVGDTNTKMSYDSMDRIATWELSGATTNVNNYTTAQSGCTYYANAQPHAVREQTQGSWSESFCYDGNGNLIKESGGRSTTWTSFNQPSTITIPSSYSDLYYDENHQRYEQIASYSGSSEDTEYIGALMEKMTGSAGTAYRYYIPAGNNFIVYNRWLSGTNSVDYATKDNIDSTAVITDRNGALVVAEKFAALGLNENTSAQQATMASITRREFTGQEGLDSVYLVDMNGRTYNASGAMFFSPDPNIPDPENTLDYDRYTYVDDNPLTLIDPTGFCGFSASGPDGTVPFSAVICASPIPDICVGCFTSFPGSGPGISVRLPHYPPTQPQQATAPKSPPQQQEALQDCINAVNGASANSNSNGGALPDKALGAASADQELVQGASKVIQNASPTAVGQLMGFTPGVVAPTNAGVNAAGATLQDALESADPYIKAAGKGVAILSVGVAIVQGSQSGGVTGAAVSGAYATADALIEGAMIDTLTPVIGVPLAIGYDKIGGTRTVVSGLEKALALQGCYIKAQGNLTLPNMAF